MVGVVDDDFVVMFPLKVSYKLLPFGSVCVSENHQ
jgi:hypothetical protein